jgi:hypothetical protein
MTPAMISIPPTTYMNSCAVPGIRSFTQGARYFGHSTRRLKNLSSPDRIGTITNVIRRSRYPWDAGSRSVPRGAVVVAAMAITSARELPGVFRT